MEMQPQTPSIAPKWEQYAFIYICPDEQKLYLSPVFRGTPAQYAAIGLGCSMKTLEDMVSELSGCRCAEDFCGAISRLQKEDYSIPGYEKVVQGTKNYGSEPCSEFGYAPDVRVHFLWAPAVQADIVVQEESVVLQEDPDPAPPPSEEIKPAGRRRKTPKWSLPAVIDSADEYKVGTKICHKNYGMCEVRARYLSPSGDDMIRIFLLQRNREETLFMKYALTHMYVVRGDS